MTNLFFQAIHCEKMKVGAIVLMPDMYNQPKSHLDIIRYIKVVSEYTEKIPILYHHFPKHTNLNREYFDVFTTFK